MGIMRPERIALFPLNVVLLPGAPLRSEEHTSELQSRLHLVCRLLLEKKKTTEHRRCRLPCDRSCASVCADSSSCLSPRPQSYAGPHARPCLTCATHLPHVSDFL